MPRMKTEKADYARFEVRMPQDLLNAYRDYADHAGRAMNTQFVRVLQEWMDRHKAPHAQTKWKSAALTP